MPKESTKSRESRDRYEFTLESGEKIFLILPPRVTPRDKNRLKTLIDLIPADDLAEGGQ